eukprot:848195_1
MNTACEILLVAAAATLKLPAAATESSIKSSKSAPNHTSSTKKPNSSFQSRFSKRIISTIITAFLNELPLIINTASGDTTDSTVVSVEYTKLDWSIQCVLDAILLFDNYSINAARTEHKYESKNHQIQPKYAFAFT